LIFLPLPFVVALLLLLFLAAMLRGAEPSKRNRPFLALVGLCALQSIILGLRWGYDITALRYVLPVLASSLPPLVWATFHSLIHREEAEVGRICWLHATPPLGMLMLLLLFPALIDVALIVLFVGYALALLNLGRSGTDALDEARFEGVSAAHRALVIAAASLCLSALFDLAVLLDFEWSKGANVALMVTNANLLGLLLLGLTALVAAQAQALPASASKHRSRPVPGQHRIVT
jgi:hypothetical protein